MLKHNETILTGKKVILFPMSDVDLEHFIKLHREDKNGYMQRYCLNKMTEDEAKRYITYLLASDQLFVFTAMTKEGKASRRAGYVYLTDLTNTACGVSGIMDSEFARGLGRQLRRDKYTYAQDALHTIVDFLLHKLNLARIETSFIEKNQVAIALAKREGFEHEGTLRKYIKIDDNFENVVVMSIVQEIKLPQEATSAIQEAENVDKIKHTASQRT